MLCMKEILKNKTENNIQMNWVNMESNQKDNIKRDIEKHLNCLIVEVCFCTLNLFVCFFSCFKYSIGIHRLALHCILLAKHTVNAIIKCIYAGVVPFYLCISLYCVRFTAKFEISTSNMTSIFGKINEPFFPAHHGGLLKVRTCVCIRALLSDSLGVLV